MAEISEGGFLVLPGGFGTYEEVSLLICFWNGPVTCPNKIGL